MKRKIIAALLLVSMASCAHKKDSAQDGPATDSAGANGVASKEQAPAGSGHGADAADETNIIAVKVASVNPELFMDSVRATGLVTTENEANLSFKMGGVIDRIYVNEGQSVTAGELLASLKI